MLKSGVEAVKARDGCRMVGVMWEGAREGSVTEGTRKGKGEMKGRVVVVVVVVMKQGGGGGGGEREREKGNEHCGKGKCLEGKVKGKGMEKGKWEVHRESIRGDS